MKKIDPRIGCLLGVAVLGLVGTAHAAEPASKTVYDVRDFGALGDGKALDTEAINAAIDAAAAAGGGTVYFRAGTYVSYSIHLKSNIALYLDHGATLKAAGTPQTGGRGGGRGGEATPDTAPGRGPGAAASPASPSTIQVNGATAVANMDANGTLTSITITNPGAGFTTPPTVSLNGNIAPIPVQVTTPATGPAATGAAKITSWDRAEPNQWDMYQDFGHSHFRNSFIWGENLQNVSILGPGLIDGSALVTNANANTPTANKALALKQCRNVTLRDVSFLRGGHFCILANAVDNFTLDNVKFDTNRDAIDIVSCKNVRISNCYVNSPNDDGICLKSDFALGVARPCENITITNCQVSGYAVGSLLDGTFDRSTVRAPDGDGPTGRIKFGTESNGGFKNITISNIVFDHCRGLAIESVDGGIIEDVTVTNITMREINNPPIYIRLGQRQRGPEGTPMAQIRRINISNITANALNPALPVLIAGMPDHPIEDLTLSNIRIVYPGGGTAQQAAVMPPILERDRYPEPSRLGIMPSSGFFIRYVKNLEMHHIDVSFKTPDARPIFNLTDVDGADFQHMKIQRFDGVPYFALNKVTDFSTQYVRSVADMKRDKIESEKIDK